MVNIQTVAQLNGLQNSTYMYAAIVAICIFFVSFIIANAIPFQGGNDRSYIKRRIGLICTVVVGAVSFWLYNDLFIMGYIKQLAFQNQFAITNLKCLGITILGSLLLSLVVMLFFRHSKFGSILGKEKSSK